MDKETSIIKDEISSLIKKYKSDSKKESKIAEEKILNYCRQIYTKLDKLCLADDLLHSIEWDTFYSDFTEINYITPSKINLHYENNYNRDDYDIDFPIEWFDIDFKTFWEQQKLKRISQIESQIQKLRERIALYNEEITKINLKEFPFEN